MIYSSLTALCVLILGLFLSIQSKSAEINDEFDYFVYSQKWPTTFCIKEFDSGKADNCLYPSNKNEWTIHGLWPNKFNGDHPFYCNESIKFNVTLLDPIRQKLEMFWPNLEAGKTYDSLWAHEWEKHGTCSLDLESINSELKYFNKSLWLYSIYNMTSMLATKKVLPDSETIYNLNHIAQQIKDETGHVPYLTCVNKDQGMKAYLSEIRLCFNKIFQPIDCEVERFNNENTSSNRNCPQDVIYPDDIKFFNTV